MDRKAFSLLEVLVAVAIVGVLSAAVSIAFRSGAQSWTKAKARMDVYQNARIALDVMSRELAAAVNVSGVMVMKGDDVTGGLNILTFMTVSDETLYQVSYSLEDNPGYGEDIIERAYIKNPDDYDVTDDETLTDTDDLAYSLTGLEFQYDSEFGMTPGWNNTGLPNAVRITVTEDSTATTPRRFSTVVYLPNSN